MKKRKFITLFYILLFFPYWLFATPSHSINDEYSLQDNDIKTLNQLFNYYSNNNKHTKNSPQDNEESAFQSVLLLRTQASGDKSQLTKAFLLLEKMAKKKHPDAQTALARAYLLGEGTNRNIISAYLWATISLSNSSEQESKALTVKNIAKKLLNKQQIETAEDLSTKLSYQFIRKSNLK